VKNILYKLVFILSIMWQAPQTIIGFLFFILCIILRKDINKNPVKYYDPRVAKYDFPMKSYYKWHKHTIITYTPLVSSGISLGCFIFINPFSLYVNTVYYGVNTESHEFGHSIQELILGWLYLLVIGIPSYIRSLIWYYDITKKPEDYNKGYPENWAERLGKKFY